MQKKLFTVAGVEQYCSYNVLLAYITRFARNRVTMISTSYSQASSSLSQLFSTNTENRTQRTTESTSGDDAASQLFDAVAESQDSSTGGFSSVATLAPSMVSSLLQQGAADGGSGAAAPADPSEMLAKIDTDGDGSISRSEFVSGRPDGVDADQAGALFDSLDTESTGSLTTEQIKDGMESHRPGPPPPGGMGPGGMMGGGGMPPAGSTDSTDSTDSDTTTANALLSELAKMVASYQQTTTQATVTASASLSV